MVGAAEGEPAPGDQLVHGGPLCHTFTPKRSRPRRAGWSSGWGACHPADLPEGLPHGGPRAELGEVGRSCVEG